MHEKCLQNGLTRKAMIQALCDTYSQGPCQWDIPDVEIIRDIPYAQESCVQCIDIYKPKGKGPFPIIVKVHGGGWWTGHRSDFGLKYSLELLEYGYAVATIGYRLVDEASLPANLQDVEDGMRFLYEHGTEYGLDTTRMCATAGSAGTTLCLTAALKLGYFRCVQLTSPILDFRTITEQYGKIGLKRKPLYGKPEQDFSMEGLVLGGSVTEKEDLCRECMPMTYMTPDAPPIQLFHGTEDTATPFLQSVEFARKAAELTGDPLRVECNLLPGTKHSNGLYNSREVFDKKLRFLNRTME